MCKYIINRWDGKKKWMHTHMVVYRVVWLSVAVNNL